MPSPARVVSLTLLAGAVLASGALWWQRSTQPEVEPVTIAVPTQMSAGTVFVARERAYFQRHHLVATINEHALGKQALKSVLDGKADLALVADVPFMYARARGEPVAAVATVFSSRYTMALLGRRDRGIASFADAAGKTLGTVKGTNSEYFLDKALAYHGIPNTAATIVDLQPEQFDDALATGRVDALTAWNPLLYRLQKAQGSNAVVMLEPDIFVYRFLLVGTRRFLDAHPERVRRTVAALADAVSFIEQQPAQGQALIAKAIGLQPQQLAATYRSADYLLSLDQALLLSLEDQTRWAMRRGLIPVTVVPNYLDAIDQRPLAQVQPASIKLIR